VLAAVLLGSAAVGFMSYRLFLPSHATGLIPVAPGRASPDRAPAGTAQSEAPLASPAKVPAVLPDIELPGIDGKTHRLTEWKGSPLIVNFWATWCDPCLREIPLLKALRREHAAERIEIVGIALDYPKEVRKYATAHGVDYPLLLGDQDGLRAAAAFGMETGLPFTVFADGTGRVVTLKVGELHRDEAELILGRIRDLEAGRLTLEATQAAISAGVRTLRGARAARE